MRPLIHLVAGGRPNFVKVAPLYHELVRRGAFPRGKRPALWDGHTAARVADSLAEAVVK